MLLTFHLTPNECVGDLLSLDHLHAGDQKVKGSGIVILPGPELLS